MIQNVFLDMDGTLLDFYKAEAVALSKTLEEMGVTFNDERIRLYSKINLEQWKKLERGEIEREDVLVGRYEIFFDKIGVKKDARAARKIYEDHLSQGHFFIDGAEDLLDTLSKKYTLHIATNGTKKVQLGRINSAGLSKYFNNIFISEDIGYNKPDKRFFQKCFEKIENFSPDTAVIIGDSLTSDILGGNNAGIKTIWYNPLHEKKYLNVKTDFETDSLSEIPNILNCM